MLDALFLLCLCHNTADQLLPDINFQLKLFAYFEFKYARFNLLHKLICEIKKKYIFFIVFYSNQNYYGIMVRFAVVI